MKPSGNPGILATFCSEGNNTCISEAEARASDSLMVARCPTDAPTAAPSSLLTPSGLLSDAPTMTSSIVSNNFTNEPIPERPHDEDDPLWDVFEDDAGVTLKSNWAVLGCLAVLFNGLFL
jgi:hypothetical protein